MGTVNEDAASSLIDHRLAVLRYESGTIADLLSTYDRALASVTTELEAAYSRLLAGLEVDDRQRLRLEALRADLMDKMRDLNAAQVATMNERLAEIAAAERAYLGRTLFAVIGLPLASVPSEQVALMLTDAIGGAVWRDRLAVDLIAVEGGLRSALGEALARGLSTNRTAALLRGLNIPQTYRGRLVAIARTETQRVANQVALATYQRNADVLDAVQWLATLDRRTCPVCGSLHNAVYPLVGGIPVGLERAPPAHPRCRCFLAPVVKSWRDLGITTDPRYDGTPAPDITFEAWLRAQPAATADDVFGKGVAARWRSGDLRLDQLVSNLRPLTLGELSARYPE